MKFYPMGLFKSVTDLELEAQNGPAVDPKRIQLDGTESFTEIVAKRLDVCRGCEYLTRGHVVIPQMEFLKCSLCGCPVKSKTLLTRSTCPKGYW
jgi:hypothetical protein